MAFLLAGLSLLATVQAANVKPVLVPNGCASLPNLQQTGPASGFAGPWNIVVDQCVNTTAIDNACTIEGFGDMAVPITLDDQPDVKSGFVSIVSQKLGAKSYLICTSGIGFEAMVFYDNQNDYLPINITSNPASAQLKWGQAEDESEPVDAYYHYIDGKKQDGIFLGANNVTSWGIQLQENVPGTGGIPMWQLRLLGPGSEDQKTGKALKEGEYKTFIRIDGS
ncbi:uncharacterized protein TRUGW13939_10416 [Talaromyces rugulosus]|uniref:Uncharacterized protein n=1 Tax=Talaromyces rugulosus TaxID=121627 RepID=A0A7H8RAX0_TALRU|nr:uncharacterized protein TRUGW13939_10416 [Talaromyces rugulosus]QKX63247.1 hypothetical protein TRUGW13939_10416 [Talaromyces rugulosus]